MWAVRVNQNSVIAGVKVKHWAEIHHKGDGATQVEQKYPNIVLQYST